MSEPTRKSVASFDGRYADTYDVDTDGLVWNKKRNKSLKTWTNRGGYPCVMLSNLDKKVHVTVHKLIAQTFIPNPDNLPQVNHINGDKTDNRAENLEWCTLHDNIRHAINTGLTKNRGEYHSSSKLTWDQVRKIRQEYVYGSHEFGMQALSKKYNVSIATIGYIIQGKHWSEEV